MNTAIILNHYEIWILLLECLFVHTPKNCCFYVQLFKYQISISFCELSLWHLKHISWNWFSIPDHVHDHSQAWMGLFGLLLTSSRIRIYGHLDDCSVLFQNKESCFYFTRILAAYTTKCSYVHLMSLEYFSVSLSGQGQQIIPDVVMSRDFTMCQHWWSLYWLCSSSISGLPSSFWARWIIHTFDLANLNQVHKIDVRL